MVELLIACALIMCASLVGVFTVWGKAGSIVEKNLDFLTSFAAGVFLIVAYQLGEEALELAAPAKEG